MASGDNVSRLMSAQKNNVAAGESNPFARQRQTPAIQDAAV